MQTKQKIKTDGTKTLSHNKYIQAIGRRKTAVAIARLYDIKYAPTSSQDSPNQDSPNIVVNNQSFKTYFKIPKYLNNITSPLTLLNLENKYFISLRCKGGGVSAQSEAARMAISRTLTLVNATYRSVLKKAGFLKRDPRVVERKKWGLKKARKQPQWQKR